ncbi:hypothetical protein OF83DRAFT_1165344 [Amylostereum chailletii]|nr:hypothetical protein OF83DRAFT_1165344 [Amylostereum chailletii]
MNTLDYSPNPLSVNLRARLSYLLEKIPAHFPHISSLQNPLSRSHLLHTLSRALYYPSTTLLVADAFRPLLLDLCARWLNDTEALESKLTAFCLLVQPHEEIYPVLSHFLQNALPENGPLDFIHHAQSPLPSDRLHRFLLSYYRILQINRELPSLLFWPLDPLSKLIWAPHLDTAVRLLAIRCYALQVGMGEDVRTKMEAEIIGDEGNVDCPLQYGEGVDGQRGVVDGWILPFIEAKRVHDARDAVTSSLQDYYAGQEGQDILPSELSPFIANVHGVLVFRPPGVVDLPPLVPTVTSTRALRSLALLHSQRLPTLITSPPSSGKSLFLSYLAATLHPTVTNQIITIALADTSLDPRSLLGSYISSPTNPGTFEWKEGILVRAMREGRWIIFEDIDRGSNEVLGTIEPLIASLGAGKWVGGRARLLVPNRGEVIAAEGFAIFSTRSLQPSRGGAFPKPSFFGSHKFHEVVIMPPTPEELRTIVDVRFPRLTGAAASAIIALWLAIKSLGSATSARTVGLRELEKYCARVNAVLPSSYQAMDLDNASLPVVFTNPSVREDLYLEARDVFFGAGALTAAARAHSEAISAVAGEHLGLSSEQCEWVLRSRVPEFDIERDANGRSTALRVGRVRLTALRGKVEVSPVVQRPFALHRPAISLISRIAAAVLLNEPVLLTGETGTGKTSVVTHMAALLHRPLVSLNLSQQTESADLLGGFKPVDARVPGSALQEQFLDLFRGTFSQKKNAKFEESVRRAVQEGKWKRVVGLWKESARLAKDRIQSKLTECATPDDELDSHAPRKRRRTEFADLTSAEALWAAFEQSVSHFEVQHVQGKSKFAFNFIEGPLVKALRSGDWILLDEINLSSPETLEAVAGLLRGPTASITLTEQGSLEPVPRHPDFRLFACMNPATDVGKKDLPPSIRSCFTEIDVPPPDADRDTLLSIVTQYIGPVAVGDKAAIMDVAEFYIAVKQLAEARQIADGSNHRPHFSMRTLARALTFASDIASSYSLRRALWEGCLMGFTMVLDEPSTQVKKLIDLARIIVTRRFPVLIEGPTSSGKTSSIEYLAKCTGHRFIRINNHEHTDIQEYLGSYVSDSQTGKLVFKDGLLVQALRQGDWIVLDELNLAPTDVLEALNRLLDDNRELVIPETQEVVRPHPHFMLFATQNPPGLYAGRKVLSRAFRNRFLEVHFEDVPQAELETILHRRCRIAPSYAQRIVSVFHELQKRRQSSRVFESKHGFATLRDLFRWAGRDAVGYQELAENGYMLLAERARREDDKQVVREIIESVMKVRIDEQTLYDFRRLGGDFPSSMGFEIPSASTLVWTKAMQRLLVLVARALRCNEPVLLVGETGSGKTSVCQVYADAVQKHLYSVNCHQNTETADLIGGLRPVRNRAALETEMLQQAAALFKENKLPELSGGLSSLVLALEKLTKTLPELSGRVEEVHQKIRRLAAIFEWHDGPLVEAMRQGNVLLLDEISLADDSVLERLNSVLEPARTVVLAERGGDSTEESFVQAEDGFKLIATMNPGGDYGKKELSPALRNRFTEIWVPAIPFTQPLLNFCEWLSARTSEQALLGLRDILAWVTFSNTLLDSEVMQHIPPNEIFHHAAHMICLDGLGSLPALASYPPEALSKLKGDAMVKLQELAPFPSDTETSYAPGHQSTDLVQLGLFAIPRGPKQQTAHSFNLQAPTTRDNAMRVVRACQLTKPILLEGSPGVGKTSLVTALAKICGYHLCRINLSDQTDLADLFGTDLPVEGGAPGEFAWKDAEFLTAMQRGHWVLLDEMNLAPQSVLEGLNAVLDHRGTVYIPELGRSFEKHPSFRIFAAQNPIQQGGGRKGLPKSYVNRFTKVFVESLTTVDLQHICHHMFPDYPKDLLNAMIVFNSRLQEEVVVKRSFGRSGSPWEFNLRDLARWGALLQRHEHPLHPLEHLRSIYLARFRTQADRIAAKALFSATFDLSCDHLDRNPHPMISPSLVQVGHFVGCRANHTALTPPPVLLQSHLPWVEAMGVALKQGWLVIVNGHRSSGKTSLVRLMADLAGAPLHQISVNNATDTTDILGSFEQVDAQGRSRTLLQRLLGYLQEVLPTSQGSRIRIPELGRLRRILASASSSTLVSQALPTALGIIDSLQGLVDPVQIESLRQSIHAELSTSSTVGRFEWVDGPLVRALKNGHWLLLDNANLCNPSVLDRLNGLCEPSGVLTLNEQGVVDGAVPVIIPHSNFRLIMCVDPQHGELSRAMRNRGIEVCLVDDENEEDQARLRSFYRLPQAVSLPNGLLDFEIYRRGIGSSSSSALIPLTHTLLRPAQGQVSLDASLAFTARSAVPAFLPHFIRILSAQVPLTQHDMFRSVLQALEKDERWRGVEGLRSSFELIWPVSSVLLRFQPMDFFTKCMSLSHSFPELDERSLTCTIIRAMDIFVRMIACEQQNYPPPQLNSKPSTAIDELSSKIVQGVQSILRVIDVEKLHHLQKVAKFLRAAVQESVHFSAVQAISRWILDSLRDGPAVFAELSSLTESLNGLVTPSSGLGLGDIWSTLFTSQAGYLRDDLVRLEQVAVSSGSGRKAYDLRSQVLNLMAIHALPTTSASTKEIEEGLEDTTTRLLRTTTTIESIAVDSLDEVVAVIKELGVVAYLSTGSRGEVVPALRTILDMACRRPGSRLSRFVPYRHAAWNIEAGHLDLSLVASLYKSWLQAIWDADKISGPSAVLQPTELRATVQKWDWTTVTLDSLEPYELSLERHCQLVVSGRSNESRTEWLAKLHRNCLLLLAFCFMDTFDSASREELRIAYEDPSQYSLNDILDVLRRSSHPRFGPAVDQFVGITITTLVASQTRPSFITSLGKNFIALFQLFVDLYVPDAPLDPAAVQRCEIDFWTKELSELSMQLHLHKELELRTTGNDTNGVIDFLGSEIEEADSHLHKSTPTIYSSTRPVSHLREYWAEVSQFLSNVVSPSRLTQLLDVGDASASTREHVVQESIAGFSQRLNTVYEDFDDITAPLQLALLQLRLGLRLVQHGRVHKDVGGFAALAGALVTFPAVRASSDLASRTIADFHVLGSTVMDNLLLQVVAIVFECDLGMGIESQVHSLDAIYEQAIRLWLIDRARQEEAEKAGQSLYRSHAIESEAVNDSELEAEEFLSLFPDYESAFTKEAQEEGDIPVAQHPAPSLTLSPQVRLLSDLHLHVFASRKDSRTLVDPVSQFTTMRRDLIQGLLNNDAASLPDTVDHQAFNFELSLVHMRLQNLKHSSTSFARPSNFYLDPNVPEVRKGAVLVQSIIQRLQSIIQEWPDQMVLHHLKGRCEQILRLSVHSPVAKVLAALEQLLLQSEDWEMYANRENSLKEQRHLLILLIVEWRKLELSSWQGLLETQATLFEEPVSEWWFRLYNACVRGLFDVLHAEGNLDSFLDELVPLIDGFITSCPIGQFQRRLDLLQSFEIWIQHLVTIKSSSEGDALRRVLRVITATRTYYLQFTSRISTSLSSQRASLESDIKGFIKLASWRDINVQALKASATRTHHQLYKSIRKFRDILRQPCAPMLQPEQANGIEAAIKLPSSVTDSTADKISFPVDTTTSAAPAHLQDLSRTYSRYDALVSSRIESFVQSRSFASLADLTDEIISTAKALASVTLPTDSLPERREKHAKALLVRKRKAWSDLLKEMKRIGFAFNVQPHILERQRSMRWNREQPILPPSSRDFVEVEKMESYFLRLSGLFPQLRAALNDHHGDIATRELQRGVMLVESGLSMALDIRGRLASAIEEYTTLRTLGRRLESLDGSRKIIASGPIALIAVLQVKNAMCRVSHAVEETIDQCQLAGQLPFSTPTPSYFFDEAQDLLADTHQMRDALLALSESVQNSATAILLEDELALVEASVSHAQKISQLLRSWEAAHLHLQPILIPVREWIESLDFSLPTFGSSSTTANADHIIDTLLVTVQSLLSAIPETLEGTEDDPDGYVKTTSVVLGRLTDLLHINKISTTLSSIFEQLAACSQGDLRYHSCRIFPFIRRFLRLVESHISSLAQWTGNLFRLEYVMCSVVHTVATKGFCKPPDAEDAGDDGEGGESAGGVGLGEGTGAQNISKEIEDESQVEGLQGDADEPNEEREKGKDDGKDAIEMGDDFEGDMEDGQQDEEEGDEGDEDLDPSDPSAGPEGKGEEGKPDSEVVAKEKEGANQKKEHEEQEEEHLPAQEPEDEELPGDDTDEGVGEVAPDDANTLDLPDDIDMIPEEQTGDDDDDEDMDDNFSEEGDGPSEEQHLESIAEAEAQGQAQGQDVNDEDQMGDEQKDDAAGDQSSSNNAKADSFNADAPESTPQDQAMSTRGGAGQSSGSGEDANDDDGYELFILIDLGQDSKDAQADPSQQEPEGPQQGNASSHETHSADLNNNPLRSLGDAVKEIQGTEEDTPQPGNTAESSQLEYLRPDDVDQDMQALGPAGAEQLVDEELRDSADAQDMMDIDDPTPSSDQPPPPTTSLLSEDNIETLQPGIEDALTERQIRSQRDAPDPDVVPNPTEVKAEIDIEVPEAEEVVEAELRRWQSQGQPPEGVEHLWRLYESLTHDLSYALCEQLRLILEPTLATRLKGDYRTGKRLNMKKIIPYIASEYTKDKIWLRRTRPSQREYQVLVALDDSRSMSESHSVHLAYQTLALVSKALTRLEVGDIGIAKFGEAVDILHGFDEGPFTDHAGMQVMSAFGFNQRATNVLSLVETSLKILEEARDRRATGSSSAADLWQLEIIISDGICQDHEKLRTVLRKAEEQRVMVVFVIIDSLQSSTEAAKASSGAVSAVNNSILSMNQVAYKNVDGRMELQMQRYLDSLPFEYYVVLRNVEALPEVLAGTLKQFFERISDE